VRGSLEAVRDAHLPEARMEFSVLPTAILVSRSDRGGTVVMGTTTAASLSIRQSAHASRLVHRLTHGMLGLDRVAEQIRAIRGIPFSHPSRAWIIGSVLIALGLAVLFRCPWWAVVVAALAALVVGAVTTLMNRARAAAAIVPFVSTFLSTTLVGVLAESLNLGPVPLFAVCAPIAILVPGAVITNALLELTASDIVTGSARLAYGVIVLGFMAVGIIAGGTLTGLRIDPDSAALIGEATSITTSSSGWAALPPLWFSWVGVAVLAVGLGTAFGAGVRFAAVGVAVMLGTYAVVALVTPATGNAVAVGIAAAALFIAARLLERLTFAVPAAIAFQSAFLLLVPGTVGLVALATLNTTSLSAPLAFVSLCIGTKIGSVIADTPWMSVIRTRGRRGQIEREQHP